MSDEVSKLALQFQQYVAGMDKAALDTAALGQAALDAGRKASEGLAAAMGGQHVGYNETPNVTTERRFGERPVRLRFGDQVLAGTQFCYYPVDAPPVIEVPSLLVKWYRETWIHRGWDIEDIDLCTFCSKPSDDLTHSSDRQTKACPDCYGSGEVA